MNGYLRQATASQVRTIGPFVDSTDFATLENALTIANTDIVISANGGADTVKNSGGATAHGAGGIYTLTWDATDSAAVGELSYSVKVAGALVSFGTYVVLEEAIYDALYAAGAASLPATAAPGAAGGLFIAGTNAPVTITGSGNALTLLSTGAGGHGLTATGEGAGRGIDAQGGASGQGMKIKGGATAGGGLGIVAQATDTIALDISFEGAGVDVYAVRVLGKGAGYGASVSGGASGTDVIADITGNLTGLVSGSVGSVVAGVTLAASAVQAIWDALTAALTTAGSIGKKLADWVIGTTQTGDSFARLGAPAGASVSADIAAIQADTDNLQTRIPAALVGGRMDASVGAMAANTVTAASIATDAIDADAIAADAVTEIQAGLSTLTPAQVNTEVLDVLVTDTFAEPAAVPAATSSLKDKIAWLFTLGRNKITQTATTQLVRNDADAATVGTSAVSDDGVTAVRGEFS